MGPIRGGSALSGGLLVVTLGWRSVFWINLPIVAVVAGLTMLGWPAKPGDAARRAVDHAFSLGLQHAYWAAGAVAIVSLAIAAFSFKGSGASWRPR